MGVLCLQAEGGTVVDLEGKGESQASLNPYSFSKKVLKVVA
jgi:hypothetical protein